MSAGVATVFKNLIGKPSSLQSKYLTHQEIPNGANFYGLVTKPHYNSKPHISDYNTAFRHFTEDFKRRGLKKLICSPMGCVRDNIPLDIFAANIVNFQQTTGASISIIIHNENSNRQLWNGLSVTDFAENLRHKIYSLWSQQRKSITFSEVSKVASMSSPVVCCVEVVKKSVWGIMK
ncbi:hypothetical protein J6590_062841 [Homalodisca vitripennis]|nr:hypothetical protein J6590_062841 [Homalodisca vitripennis]